MTELSLLKKFDKISEYWAPKIVGELNGQYVKLAKFKGEVDWHTHEFEDELFLVLQGSIVICMEDEDIFLESGDFYIVARGTRHKPMADQEAHVLLFEPKSTKHTGDVRSKDTVEIEDQHWI